MMSLRVLSRVRSRRAFRVPARFNTHISEINYKRRTIGGEGDYRDLILKGIKQSSNLLQGEALHGLIIKTTALNLDLGKGLIQYYSALDNFKLAKRVYHEIPKKDHDMVLLSTIIRCSMLGGDIESAVSIYKGMGVKFISQWCRNLRRARGMRYIVIQNAFSVVLNMLVKTGFINEAADLFLKIKRDVGSYNIMINGLGLNGEFLSSLKLFKIMLLEGIKADDITFLALLSGSCHFGGVKIGIGIYHMMSRKYSVYPGEKHFGCIVDLLSKTGFLNEANEFLLQIPLTANARMWTSVLNGCRTFGDFEFGQYVFYRLLEFQPQDTAHYVLFSHICAKAGEWEEFRAIHKVMRNHPKRYAGSSAWLQFDSAKPYSFLSSDGGHHLSQDIYRTVNALHIHCRDQPYRFITAQEFLLRRIYENVQEPLLNATSLTGDNRDNPGLNPYAALLGNQTGGQVDDRSTTPSTITSDANSRSSMPNANPLPNPWSRVAATRASQTNNASGYRTVGSNIVSDITGWGIPGPSGVDTQSSSLTDPETMIQLLQNPAMLQMLNQVIDMDPQLQSLVDSNPQLLEAMQNQERLSSQLPSHERLQQSMASLSSLFGSMSQQSPSGMGQTAGVAAVPPEELYADQLSQLRDVGFIDTRENIQALIATSGNVHAAVERLLQNLG